MNQQTTPTQFLQTPEGKISYDVQGKGPLVICVAGMGDLRSSYRYMTPGLVKAGYKVVQMDLRGHGESDTTFSSYGDEETAEDLIAMIKHFNEPATIVGNSMGAGAGVIAAAKRPELVRDLVFIGPFVREPKNSKYVKPILNFLTLPLWGAATFNMMLPMWFKGNKPADYKEYRKKLIENIKKPGGYTKAFSRTTRITHTTSGHLIHNVKAPSFTLVGEFDPDFPNPKAEMEWIKNTLHGEGAVIENASHYPQSQQPEKVLGYILPFLKEHHNA